MQPLNHHSLFIVPQLLFSGVLINFDRLNNLIENPSNVPLIGELMPCRWAYEAMAVHQFKGNRFTREFFEIDQTSGNAYYENQYMSLVRSKLNEANHNIVSKKPLAEYEGDLLLLRNELQHIVALNTAPFPGSIESLNPENYNESVFQQVSDYLVVVQDHFRAIKRDADRMKDAKSAMLLEAWGGEEQFIEMKHRYTNKRLEDILTNKVQLVVEWDNHYVRKNTPIYMEPQSRYGRAHFYAPVKKLGNLTIDTFWFNLFVIWISAIGLYFLLIADLLSRFSNWNQVRRLRRR